MVSGVQLYDDQKELVDKISDGFRRGVKWQLLQSPTGSGKSRMGAYMAATAMARGLNVLIDVPMKELRKQLDNTFVELGIDHSFIAAGLNYNPFLKCWISTTPSIANRLDRIPKIDLAILDECHQGGAQRERLIAHLKATGAWGVGLSATPERLDGKGLDEYYDELVLGQNIRWLIDNKRLSDYELYTPSRPNLSALRTGTGGEYVQADVASYMEHDKVLIGDATRHYLQYAKGMRNVSYCASIKHSKMVCEEFNNAGIPSAHIDGTMTDSEREVIIKKYARREILNLCNADLLLYGFDLAAASGDKNAVVESISDLKPTMSKAMQFQKIGRALRYKTYPAQIFDHSGNSFNPDGSAKHGIPCAPIDWNWRGREKRKGASSEKTIPVRQCGICFMAHKPAPVCPKCGHVYEIKSSMIDVVDGELIKVDLAAFKDVKKEERKLQGQAKTLDELITLGKRKGYKNPHAWAKKVIGGRKHG